jgi:hypothetical protein
MISVIVYGRNDSYGYNLHKRAAISLNCIAEVLTDPQDEILFVDCNTPNGMPTFPEAIADTLTEKARKLLRIFRLRPELYEKHKKGSPLKALEPLSRNIALRRSNPANRWILSTNTDMVFVVRDFTRSLSEVAANLSDGLYELPRFEVPGALWETVDRHEPRKIIASFAEWGQRLHLNVAVISRPEIRFDGPGDFQLMPREQIFAIHGFNEEMVLGWHVDSNLCQRLFLLNGKTESLLDQVFAYHCDHTRQVTAMHDSAHRTENDQKRFIYEVRSPYLPAQEDSWGIPGQELEELGLTDECRGNYSRAMEKLLPGMVEPVASDSYLDESYDQSQVYDNFHVLPFLADYLLDSGHSETVGYFGGNVELLNLLQKFRSNLGCRGAILVDRELIASALPHCSFKLSESCQVLDRETLLSQADVYIFDAGLTHLQSNLAATNIKALIDAQISHDFRIMLAYAFYRTVTYARKWSSSGANLEKQFLLIAAQNTWFEKIVLSAIGTTVTPYSTHVRQGFALRVPRRSIRKGLFSTLFQRDSTLDKTAFAKQLSRRGRSHLRAGEYEKAQKFFLQAFCCCPFDRKNLGRLLLAHFWGLRKLYAQHKTTGQVSGAKVKLQDTPWRFL